MNHTGKILIVAPHPDDEVIGAGAILCKLQDPWIVHLTDGAPRDMGDALRSGFSTREAYAQARRREALAALELAGVAAHRLKCLGFVDQGLAWNLAALASRLGDLFSKLRPVMVLTPAYEGGHPDHDSAAFGVHMAREMVSIRIRPMLVEYALYHQGLSGLETGRFLPGRREPIERPTVGLRDAIRKKRMLDCFLTQQDTLRQLRTVREPFRRAPEYCFLEPPHPGRLFYEQFDWGVTGAQWRELAQEAASVLQLSPAPAAR
ncbi:MAG: PIG-L family deacetylase [Bryobacteraceae bacterium]